MYFAKRPDSNFCVFLNRVFLSNLCEDRWILGVSPKTFIAAVVTSRQHHEFFSIYDISWACVGSSSNE